MQQSALEHLKLHHGDADGWITLARKGEGRFRQHHFKLDEMPFNILSSNIRMLQIIALQNCLK